MDTEEGSEVEFVGEFDGDQHSVYSEGEGDEDDENLLDEQEQEEEDGTGEGVEENVAEGEGDDSSVPATPAEVSMDKAADQEGGGLDEQDDGDRVEDQGSSEDSEDDTAEIIDPINLNLRPDPRFFAVRSMLAGSMEPRLLNKRMKRPELDSGFLVDGDERWYRNANTSCTSKMMNLSASFKPNGRCHTCLSGKHNAWIGSNGQPVVFIAGDQHFPANLPADGEGECFRILRI